MKKSLLSIAAMLLAVTGMAQNKVNLTLTDGNVESFNTTDVQSIDIDGGRLTVNPVTGAAKTYEAKVAGISFVKNIAGHVQITEAGGWFETAYVKWNHFDGATNYEVYVKGENLTDWTRLDYQLVRNYGNYGRADMPGLKAGSYMLKVVPVVGGKANEAAASETAALEVRAHNRGGFAHFNYPDGVGAYKNDGTLKDGARILYVNAKNAKTVSLPVCVSNKEPNGTVQTGLGTILKAYEKNLETRPLAIRVIGKITDADMDALLSDVKGLQLKGKGDGTAYNVTIEGIGDDATFHGFGVAILKSTGVEVRNIGFLWFNDDGLSIKGSTHCWIHNNDVFYGKPGSASDQKKGDGSMDIKDNSQYVTFSYNHFWDSGKTSLCGMKSETGPNYLTYHHNWFDHSDSRHPRVRTMSVHIYNNYFDGVAKYGAGATTGADLFVEANYFRDTKYPIMSSLQGTDILGDGGGDGSGTFSTEDGGSIKAYGNVMCGLYWYRPYSDKNTVEFDCWEAPTRDAQMPSSIVAKKGGDTYSNWDTNKSLMYDYTADKAEDVPSIVKGIYGAGRINHGDFKWRFNNNTQDKNYEVIQALSDAIKAYDSYLIGNYEGETSINSGKGFNTNGIDATEGDEFPFGNGNAATGSVIPGGGTTDPVEPGDVFMASADGTDYFWFNAANADAVNAFIADGTITLGTGCTFRPDYQPKKSDGSWTSTYTGSIEAAMNGGVVTFKCPSVSSFVLQLARSGSFKGTIDKSTDNGATWTTISTLNQKAGNHIVDLSASAASDTEVLIRITNTATGGLNIHGVKIIKAKAK